MQLPLKFKFLLISEKRFFTYHAGSSKTAASIWILTVLSLTENSWQLFVDYLKGFIIFKPRDIFSVLFLSLPPDTGNSPVPTKTVPAEKTSF